MTSSSTSIIILLRYLINSSLFYLSTMSVGVYSLSRFTIQGYMYDIYHFLELQRACTYCIGVWPINQIVVFALVVAGAVTRGTSVMV